MSQLAATPGTSTNGLCKKYHFTRLQLAMIPMAHGLDALTRIQMRLASLDEFDFVWAPGLNDYCINAATNDFVWVYMVQRKIGVSWAEAEDAMAKALGKFFRTFATV